MKVSIVIDDIRLRYTLNIDQTLKFTKKIFFYTILGFLQCHSGPRGDIDGFLQFIPGSYKSEKSGFITGTDTVHPKCDCIIGSIVNGIR